MMNQCPCGSGRTLEECCQPLLDGVREARTAEELLRARYTSHCLKESAYILKTIHPDKSSPDDKKTLEEWFRTADWTELKILDIQQGGSDDDEGQIEFIAEYSGKKGSDRHHELSIFKKFNGQWRFYDSQPPQVKQYIRASPKIGRNHPCPCGSGKKYKKCCGK